MMRDKVGRLRRTTASLVIVSLAAIGLSRSTTPVSADAVASVAAQPVAAAAGASWTWSDFGKSAGRGAVAGTLGGLTGSPKGAVVGAVVGAVAGAVTYIIGWLFGSVARADSYPATALD